MGGLVAVLNKKGENAVETAITMLAALDLRNIERYGVASSRFLEANRTAEQLKPKGIDSSAIVGHAFSRTLREDKPTPAMLTEGALVYEGRTYTNLSIESLLSQNRGNPEQALTKFLKYAEGEYSLALALRDEVIAGRDSLGVRPLYYGENEELIAVSTERKALWKIDINETHSFPPGNTAILGPFTISFEKVKTVHRTRKTSYINSKQALTRLAMLLEKSVRKRITGMKEVAVAFSGGLDSSIISFIAKKCGANAHLIYVSLKDQKETENARRISSELELPMEVYIYDEQAVKKTIPKTLSLIEEPDPVKVSIAIPFFWIAEKASEMGLRVVLAGQGADELFGGYKRYVSLYVDEGRKRAEKAIFKDVMMMHETNFERDFKICNYHNVELRLPFADFEIASFALDLPLELKIEKSYYTLRKLILRKAAEKMGLPKEVIDKPKKAVQYATGVNEALRRIARAKGLSVAVYLQNEFQQSFGDKQ
jgi:asparagine synthase (glutamine-hydrolysing)